MCILKVSIQSGPRVWVRNIKREVFFQENPGDFLSMWRCENGTLFLGTEVVRSLFLGRLILLFPVPGSILQHPEGTRGRCALTHVWEAVRKVSAPDNNLAATEDQWADGNFYTESQTHPWQSW